MVTHVLNFEAIKKGRLEGKLEGKLEAQIDNLLSILEARGVQDQKVTQIIKLQTDIAKLKRWVVLAATKPIEDVQSEICKEQA